MPLLDCDFKQLEILCAAYLSKDKVLYDEINNNADIHSNNQSRLRLPTRLVAKTFIFRLIYGGSAFAYANDPEFAYISSSNKYWQRVIDEFYAKYTGLYRWHGSLVREVNRTGKLVMPTGRVYEYYRDKGEWPKTKILNYPVQGLGADIMAIARVSLFNKLQQANLQDVKLICTVHDSIIFDLKKEYIDTIVSMVKQTWLDIPRNFEVLFKSKFDLPCKVEMKYGPDWGHMTEIKL